jgi:gliding motility-associated protein GldM
MSLPKEPRQKMINMMYLVLTALLALNVSKEILNAFQIVDKSMQNSTTVTNASTGQIMSSFESKKKDPSSRANAEIWMPKAQAAIDLSKKAYEEIEAFKKELLTMKDTSISKDNMDASTLIFVENKKGEEIYDKFIKLKKDLLAIDPEIAKEFANGLPVDIAQTEKDKKDWAYRSFHMMPTVASLTILSKLQSDIKTSENKIAAYCHSKVGEVVVKYDSFSALVGQSSNYLMPGEKIKITGGLGAFSSSNTPSITINGSNVAVTNGQGAMELDAGGAGEHTANVTVSFKDQNGVPQTKTETIKWTVGQPSGASVSADKMNVLYIGVANPVTVASGAGWDKTSVSFGGLSSSGSQGRYVITPGAGSEGIAKITVTSNGKPSVFEFRVKRLPPATAGIGPNLQQDGAMSSASFRAMGGIRAALLNSDFNANYTVVGYTITGTGAGFPTPASAQSTSGFWSGGAATIANKAIPGSYMIFTNIVVQGPDGRSVKAANSTVAIKCN